MQSIYFFRDADAELFPRVRTHAVWRFRQRSSPLRLCSLTANFRTEPALVRKLNEIFVEVFCRKRWQRHNFFICPTCPQAEP